MTHKFTDAQFLTLGRLLTQWAASPANRYQFVVQSEMGRVTRGAPFALLRVTDAHGEEAVTVVHAIAPDGRSTT